jgi:nicotinamide-nucleotide amidase
MNRELRDQTHELVELIGRRLAQQKKTIAVAESCTGGLLAELLTEVPGASAYFTHGWVAYSNLAKINELDVPAALLEKYGAVSEQVAEAMAEGARRRARADFAIAVTGIAGPAGGGEQKPVGLVYIAVQSDNCREIQRFTIPGDRNSVRLGAANAALNMLRARLRI